LGKEAVSRIILTLLMIAVSTLVFNLPLVKTTPGTIYIRADGSIDPPTAPISSVDNVTYTFADNIYDEIVVERSNITVNGNGYALQGSGVGFGFYLSGINNVTIKNTNIDYFEEGIVFYGSSNFSISGNNITNNENGIWLDSSSNFSISGNDVWANSWYGIYLWQSSHSSIYGNNITNNWDGLVLYGSSNYINISGNNIIANNEVGIGLDDSSNGSIHGNSITYNQNGILLSNSSDNSVYGNNITNNYYYGVYLEYSSGSKFFHNNFIDNTWAQVYIATSGNANLWDDGYPSGGNYWSDYTGVDYYSGPNQDQPSGDGIGDTPYLIDQNNTDRYPLMNREQYDWPRFGYDPASTGYSPSTAPNTNATAWVSDMPGGSGWSSPVVAEDKVFIGIGWTPTFTAWDEETGDFLWSFEAAADIDISVSAAVAYGMVFFGAGPPGVPEGWIYALNATTGEQIWNFTTEGDVRASPVVTEGRLYIGGDLDSTGKVYCINATTGESIWNYTTQDRMTSVAVAYGKVYAGCGHWETLTKAAIYCLDMYDGSLVWSFDTDRDHGGALSVANGKVYFSASYEGSDCAVFALNATNGDVVWSTTRYSNGEAGRVSVAYGKVFISLGYSARGVYALNETNGDEIWAFPIVPEQPGPGHENNPGGGPVVADGKVFFAWGYPGHMFYAVNETTGTVVWSYELVGSVHSGSSAIANGRVFVADHFDKKLYAFGGPPYVARIKAYCYTEGSDISVGITMDGSPTGYNTTHTFTGLTGTHNFTVPDTDLNDHLFKQWNTGETSTTITVTSGGTYIAYYQAKCNLTITTTTGGTTDPSPGTYTYWEGTIVSVTANPYTNYVFDHWELDGFWYSSNPISVTMDSDHTLRAVFAEYSPPPPVGGIVSPVDKLGLLAPYIGLASTILVATVATVIYVKRIKKREQNNGQHTSTS